MSILANKDTRVVIQGGQAGVNAARRMAEFCYLIKRPLNVEAFVYPPTPGRPMRYLMAAASSLFLCTSLSLKRRRTTLRSIPVWSTLAQTVR